MIKNKEELMSFLEAVDEVCVECTFGEETCDNCPVTKTVNKLTKNNNFINTKENNNMIKTWEELKEKYNNYEYRENMSKERERGYVNDLFSIYENEGFNKVFWSPYNNEGEEKYYGKTFKVLGRCSESRNNLSLLPLWGIEFEDGKQLTVEPCEIIFSQMKAEGCPEEYLIKINSLEEELIDKKKQEELEKKSLKAQLLDKLNKEFDNFKEILHSLTVDEVIELAYKYVMFKEFICVFESFADTHLSKSRIINFLNQNNLLDSLYNEWMRYESEEQEIYKEFIFGVYDEEF